MAVTAQTIANSVRLLVNDEDSSNYRWSDADLLSFVNEAQRDICNRVLAMGLGPAYMTTEIVELAAGSQQSLDACNAGSGTTLTGLQLVDVIRNVGVSWVDLISYSVGDIVYDTTNNGTYKCSTAHTAAGTAPASDSTNWTATSEDRKATIDRIHPANLEQLIPNWRSANTDDTGTDGVAVQFWMEDPHDDETWHVYPQQPDSSYKMNIEIVYAAEPAATATISSNITLGDRYQDAIRDYVIHMCYAIDDEVDQNGNTMSEKWFRRYLSSPVFR